MGPFACSTGLSGAVHFEKPGESGQNWRRLAFAPNARFLAGGSYDGTAKIWQWTGDRLEEPRTLEGHERAVHDVAFSPDGRTLATASFDGTIGVWDVETGKRKSFFPAADVGRVPSVGFSPDGETVFAANADDQTIRRFTLDGTPVSDPEFPKANDRILWAALGPHGRRVAVVGREHIVTVYNARTGKVEHRLPGHEQTVLKAIFSPDGEQLATLGGGGTVRFWNLTKGEELFTIRLLNNISPVQAGTS
jgi:WD40 repeat protein